MFIFSDRTILMPPLVIASEAKQSRAAQTALDCFASLTMTKFLIQEF